MISPSIVNTKYGQRPLIEAAPISFDMAPYHNRRGNIADPNYLYNNQYNLSQHQQAAPRPNTYSYNQPAAQVQRSSNVVPYPIHNNPQYHPPPPQQNMPMYQQLPPIPQQQHQQQHQYYPQQALQPQVPANTGYIPPQQHNMPAQEGSVHLYYGPNGERLPGPPNNLFGQAQPNNTHFASNHSRLPVNFTLEGTLQYGHMTSIEVKQSNISYRDLPDFLIRDLKKRYGSVKKTHVKITSENGEYNIYGTPLTQTMEGSVHGYLYDNPRQSQTVHGHRYVDDPYTKRYGGYANFQPDMYDERPRGRSVPVGTNYVVDEVRQPLPRPVRYD